MRLLKKKEQVLELIVESIKEEMPYANESNDSFYGSGR